jgi:hypothetical protein
MDVNLIVGYIAFFVIWFMFSFFLIVYYWKYRVKINKSYDNITVKHENCISLSAKHLYLIKLSYGNRRDKFFIRSTTISLDLMDKNKQSITRIDISPKIFSATHKSNRKRGIKGPKLLLKN